MMQLIPLYNCESIEYYRRYCRRHRRHRSRLFASVCVCSGEQSLRLTTLNARFVFLVLNFVFLRVGLLLLFLRRAAVEPNEDMPRE